MTTTTSPGLIGIRAGAAWDGVGGLVRGGVVVLADPADGRIVDVTGPVVPTDILVFDHGPDTTILPGLLDTHTHLCFDPSGALVSQMTTDSNDTLLVRAAHAGRTALEAGITTVRDLGDRGYVTLALRAGGHEQPGPSPEILVAGPPITPTQGHCWFLGGEADGEAGVAGAVADRARHGVDVIKVMATGGMLTPGYGMHESQYDRAELRAAVTAAHAARLPIVAHAHGTAGIANAIAAGVDGVEHATFLTADGVDCDPRVLDRLAASGTFVGCNEAWLPSDEPFPPAAASRLETVWRNFARMHDAGVHLIISSDAGVGPRKPHDVLPHGAILLDRLGVPSHDVLAMVTSRAAVACGLNDRKGRLLPGHDADLLVVDGNPLAEMTALLRPLTVIRAGTVVRREQPGASLGADHPTESSGTAATFKA